MAWGGGQRGIENKKCIYLNFDDFLLRTTKIRNLDELCGRKPHY